MAIEITKPNPKVDSTHIHAFEAQIGETLPLDYRNFLIKFNGGKPENNEFNIFGTKNFGGVNNICLSLRPDTLGQVFFWDHELEAEEGEPATFANLFKIGNSFNHFFEELRKFDTTQVRLKPGQVKKVWINPKFLEEQRKKGNAR